MIPLRLQIEPPPLVEPLVVRLRSKAVDAVDGDAILRFTESGHANYEIDGFALRVQTSTPDLLDGDVVLLLPGKKILHRLIRASSQHNTFLVTEQCDQLCIMCSQPPKRYHVDLFDSFLEAVTLAPRDARIGISGGEPLLHKTRLFSFLIQAQIQRPDVGFHILTNGQHFDREDLPILRSLNSEQILWGVPIYAADTANHDRIVKKDGAFNKLLESFAILASGGARIELRTVVLSSNFSLLANLSHFITRHLSFVDFWAIMQLENIGFARKNWEAEFFDSSKDFSAIAHAIDISASRGSEVVLYNFPLCTVPAAYRSWCANSISDWKQKYLEQCEGCLQKSMCTGFFEWYPPDKGFSKIGAI